MSSHSQLLVENCNVSVTNNDEDSHQSLLPPILIPLPSLPSYSRISGDVPSSIWEDLQSPSIPLSTSMASSTATSPTAMGYSSSFHANMPSEFPAFASLAPEIRDLIWSFTLPRVRLVPLRYHSQSKYPFKRHFSSSTALPVAFSVCRDSRNVALRRYSSRFVGAECQSPSPIYFDEASDILYFPEAAVMTERPWFAQSNSTLGTDLTPSTNFHSLIALLCPSSLQRVRRIALHQTVFLGRSKYRINPLIVEAQLRDFWWHLRDKFKGLEEVTITGRETTAVLEFGLEQEQKIEHENASIQGHKRFPNENNRLYDMPLPLQTDFSHISLYDIALKTYWEVRQREPQWKPPRWRVWQESFTGEDVNMI